MTPSRIADCRLHHHEPTALILNNHLHKSILPAASPRFSSAASALRVVPEEVAQAVPVLCIMIQVCAAHEEAKKSATARQRREERPPYRPGGSGSHSQSMELTRPFCSLTLLFSKSHMTHPHTNAAKISKDLLSVGMGFLAG